MSAGLLSLLDDVAALAKLAAASLDDVATGAMKATGKAAGVVIDDTAVTPKYVVGLSPARELPIVWNIAKGSLRNKLLILLPALMLLGQFLPGSIQPLLAVGALYLCFEGYEKLHHSWQNRNSTKQPSVEQTESPIDPKKLELERTRGAIRTDFVLSAEIMAIGYATVQDESLWIRLGALTVVALGITAGVYGVVALILKADDLGLRMSVPGRPATVQKIGRWLVHGMPGVLAVLSAVGTAAMLWVGGGILIHNVPPLHHLVSPLVEKVESPLLHWALDAFMSLILAIPVGALVAFLVRSLPILGAGGVKDHSDG